MVCRSETAAFSLKTPRTGGAKALVIGLAFARSPGCASEARSVDLCDRESGTSRDSTGLPRMLAALSGPSRQVHGRRSVTYMSEDWIDGEVTSHRGPDE